MDAVKTVASMTGGTFLEVVQAAPRKVRETLFGRLGIKAKKRGFGLRVGGKMEDRAAKLHLRLKESQSSQEGELCLELLRNWLYTKRSLLVDTLDFLEVKHDNGLIEDEPTFFAELSEEKTEALVKNLKDKGHPEEWIALYLSFVDVPNVERFAKVGA